MKLFVHLEEHASSAKALAEVDITLVSVDGYPATYDHEILPEDIDQIGLELAVGHYEFIDAEVANKSLINLCD